MSTRRLVAVVVAVVVCEGVGGVAGLATQTSVQTWYPTLAKPWFTPPDAVFAPVWIVLYAVMGVAAGRVWNRRQAASGSGASGSGASGSGASGSGASGSGAPDGAGAKGALGVFALQLALNAGWSVVFFGMRSVPGGLVVIAALWTALVATVVRFAAVDRIAAWLLAPYLAWVTYAAALNAGIWILNG